MTRLYFRVGNVRLRMIAITAACLTLVGVGNLAAYRFLLEMPEEQWWRELVIFAALLALLFVLLSGLVWLQLRPVARLLEELKEEGIHETSEHDEAARRAALRFPLAFTGTALIVSIAATLAGLVADIEYSGIETSRAFTLAIVTLTQVVIICAFIYVITRSLMRPIIAHFRHEEVPPGLRISIHSKVTLAFFAICLTATVPTAMICTHQLKSNKQLRHQLARRHLAEAVAYGAAELTPEGLAQATASVHLTGQGRIRFRNTPAATAARLPQGHRASHVNVLSALPPVNHGVLVVLVVVMLGLSVLTGSSLGASLSHDIRLVSSRLKAIAETDRADRQKLRPLIAEAPQFSDLRQLAEAVNDLLDRIVEITVTHFLAIEKTVEADRVKTQFLANVSHDLRSPLNAVLGFSELLLRMSDEQLSEEQRDYVATVNRCGNNLLHLINDVLDIAKVEAGRTSLSREDCMPVELISNALKEVQRRRVPDSIQIDTELQAGMPAVMVDPQRLTQAMAYIIRFCVDSMEQGRIVVQLKTQSTVDEHTQEKQKSLRFRVATTSGGLVEREVQQVFSGFSRKPGQRGLGLGLPLAKAFIEMHDGTLNLASTPGVGTTFTVEIPLMQPKVLARLRPRKKPPTGEADGAVVSGESGGKGQGPSDGGP